MILSTSQNTKKKIYADKDDLGLVYMYVKYETS